MYSFFVLQFLKYLVFPICCYIYSNIYIISPQIISSLLVNYIYRSKVTMLVKRKCSYQKGESDACTSLALPCTQHCIRHIVYNVDQLLYEHCTAKFSDNTQCCVPVFDICHELPLCPEHARKRVCCDNIYIYNSTKEQK